MPAALDILGVMHDLGIDAGRTVVFHSGGHSNFGHWDSSTYSALGSYFLRHRTWNISCSGKTERARMSLSAYIESAVTRRVLRWANHHVLVSSLPALIPCPLAKINTG